MYIFPIDLFRRSIMTLALNTSDGVKVVRTSEENAPTTLLQAYLDGAVALTEGKPKSEAKRMIEEYHKKSDLLEKTQGLLAEFKMDVFNKKETELKKKASPYSLKTKVNYASDADFDNFGDVLAGGLLAVATPMLAHVISQDPSTLGATMFVATAAYMSAKAGKMIAADLSASKNDKEKKNAQSYADIKHAQLALKLLKKELKPALREAKKAQYKEEVNKLFAAGYGQPSGGFVQAVALKNQKGR